MMRVPRLGPVSLLVRSRDESDFRQRNDTGHLTVGDGSGENCGVAGDKLPDIIREIHGLFALPVKGTAEDYLSGSIGDNDEVESQPDESAGHDVSADEILIVVLGISVSIIPIRPVRGGIAERFEFISNGAVDALHIHATTLLLQVQETIQHVGSMNTISTAKAIAIISNVFLRIVTATPSNQDKTYSLIGHIMSDMRDRSQLPVNLFS